MNQEIRILIADDDAEDRFIISDAFREIGLQEQISFAADGTEVISYLNDAVRQGIPPALIVLDLNMPKLNGTDTLRMLKADDHLQDLPVVIFSTSVNELEKEECLRIGALEYLTKPVSYKDSITIARYFYEMAERLSGIASH